MSARPTWLWLLMVLGLSAIMIVLSTCALALVWILAEVLT